jgi:hypothetical protein
MVVSVVSLSGTALLISGLRYKERINRKTLTGEQREAYLRSGYFVATMIGAVIFFSGLAGGALANHMHAGPVVLWFLAMVIFGMLVMLVAKIKDRL